MLRELLKQRFKLAAHHESKQMPVYALTAGSAKPKLYAVHEGEADPALEVFGGRAERAGNHWSVRGTVEDLAISLSRRNLMDRVVIDKTGIKGAFFFFLQWDQDQSLEAAVHEDLGLKIQSRRAAIEVLAIDHVEKADEN